MMTDKDHMLHNDGQKTSFFRVSGLDCGSCAMKIETALTKTPGVITVNASITSETVTVDHAPNVSRASLANKLNGLGYSVIAMAAQREQLMATGTLPERKQHDETTRESVHHHDGHEEHGHGHGHNHSHDDTTLPWWRKTDGQITIACTLAIAAAYCLGFYSSRLQSIAFLLITLVALTPVALKAWRGLRSGFPFSIESLLVVAALGALILGAMEEAAFVVLLFLIGEFLEGFAANQARRGIRGLTDLIPKVAFIENKDGSLSEISISALTIGTTIVVRPGDRIPADGIITAGTSSIDDSPVTGESVPKTKAPGAPVFAGSINHEAVLRVQVTSDTANNTIARIAQLVEEAQERKSPTQRFINRFSQVYTPIIFALGLSVAVIPPLFGADWVTWIYRGLAVLLIGCPCALVISTPAALASSIAAATRRGLLVKGGEVLEELSKVVVAAFDKTGTLTNGTPCVTDIYSYGVSQPDLLALTAQVEAASSHPLAKALVAHSVQETGISPTSADTTMIAGKGIKGNINGKEIFIGSARSATDYASFSNEQDETIGALQTAGKTVVTVTAQGTVIGIFGLRDELKPDAIDGVTTLQKQGINVIMLTGDTQATAKAIASELGITVHSELMPHDKMEIIKTFQAKGQAVVKIGDGINDAPALACANVGIAMAGGPGGGTDIALEAGDAAILQGRVSDVAQLVDLAKRTMRNIHQNLAIAIGLKLVFLVTTILGITGLWPAIMADTGATILVTLNALRLLRIRKA